MLRNDILSAVLLLGSTVFCHAQTRTSPWSVGVQATAQRYTVNYTLVGVGQIGDEVSIIPVQVTGGYRLSPRALLQLGAAYRKTGITTSFPFDSALPGFVQKETYASLAVPLTLRYALGRRLEKRFLLDGVAGLGLLYSRHTYLRITNSAPPFETKPAADKVGKLFLTFGLSARYRFGSHVEGVFDALLNKSLSDGGTLSPRFYNVALGVRYNF